jgi:glutamate dehydrogenase
MTTRSIHQYVLGVLDKLGLDESKCTKFQTGGPDGDLGSNEIKISKDKTIAIVDGSGVLYDPNGIDKEELRRYCAAERKMARFFDKSKLSPKGWFVDVDQSDVKLPDGTVVASGMDFRNQFHLNPLSAADLFVPCGGRPEAINIGNVNQLIDKDTKLPRFKIIVEGANLFFTQEARLILEKQGVIIFKVCS